MIFICTFDPFRDGLFRYTYDALCRENGRSLEDEACRIFLNTKGRNPSDVPPELVQFLSFVEQADESSCVEDDFLKRLFETMSTIKKDRRMEERYMLFGEMLNDQRKEGREEGCTQMLALISAMAADGRTDELQRLTTDSEFLKEMMVHYHVPNQ